ncbi:MAG: NAD(P)/FAD-dependent oxidoreductase [Planctomycetota bacterium]
MTDQLQPQRHYFRGSTDGKRPLAHDPLVDVKSSYDVLIVGSGLAGLTAANILAKNGHRVALFEQHYNLGGLATWFKRRGGHIFDISLHGFPIGMKKTCRKYWNADIAGRIEQLESVRFQNPQFELDTVFTRQDFTRHLVTTFGLPLETVEAFYEAVRGMDFFDDSGETVGELFDRFFPGRNDVHRLLMEPISYANGSSLDDPAISYGIVFSNFMSQGVFTFTGGTDRLVKAMKKELLRNGCALFHSTLVERILVENGAVRGVLANGREVRAPIVVSNANVKTTIEKLVGPDAFPADFLAASRAVRLNTSSTQVYMGVAKGQELPFVGDLFFTSTRPTFDSHALSELHGESRTYSFYYPKIRPDLNRYSIVSSTNAYYQDWASMSDTEYSRAKQRLATDTLAHLESVLPGTRAKIDHVEVSTPRTFAFYTAAPEGTSFGTKFEGLGVSMDLSKHVRGLFHSGSVGIIMSGWLGAANYGAITANKVDALLHATQASLQS